ncbi:MAG TPA: glycosyltransferase family 2 protein [Candidatus Acidoferrum sp.]|nr:glycosyltransferase family 2 protein [Candidatus Acidoferrum sp.]
MDDNASMNYRIPHISPLVMHDRRLWGWAVGPGLGFASISLLLDNHQVATELTGQHLPAAVTRVIGKPVHATAGFCFALPAALGDGFAHQLQVVLNDGTDGLFSPLLTLPAAPIRGEVRQQADQLIGTVWFESRPSKKERLLICDDAGEVASQILLSAVATSEAHGYPAHFTAPLRGLAHAKLHVSCNGQPLRGSPLVVAEQVMGAVEKVTSSFIRGWAFDQLDPSRVIELALRIDGKKLWWFRTQHARDDLVERLSLPAGIEAAPGFQLQTPPILQDGQHHLVEIFIASSGRLLDHGMQHLLWEPVGKRYRPAPVSVTSATKSRRFPPPAVSIVILNRNGAGVLAELLASFERHNRTLPAELIVVDHASTDGSRALLKQWQRRLDLNIVPLKRNDSFSASCNRGAALARSPLLLFLNNDIVWLHDALPAMVDSLRDEQVGIVGLKLLKVVGEVRGDQHHTTDVQHLGVRFALDPARPLFYWPTEVDPYTPGEKDEYGPLPVPAVTGAALLCRKRDFDAVGGFDTGYFYLFEDIELCLRLSRRMNKRVICRNDCVALHHHGLTRLSNREHPKPERTLQNFTLLQRHVGFCLKQSWWRSLLAGDGFYTRETLCIGLVGTAEKLAPALAATWPRADIRLLGPETAWKQADAFHVLVIGDPLYDIRTLQQPRSDLLTVAWIEGEPAKWATQPWWDQFGAVLAPRARAAKFAAALRTCVHGSNARAPLAFLLDPDQPRLRTLIRSEHRDLLALRRARQLQAQLRKAGIACWLDDDATPPRMIDVCVKLTRSRATQALTSSVEAGAMYVEWPESRRAPTARWLMSELEKHVGNTDHSS